MPRLALQSGTARSDCWPASPTFPMTTSLRFPTLGALLLALTLTAHAQLTYTNAASVAGNVSIALNDSTAVQTFTGFTSITSMTWQVVNTSGSAQTASFNAYIGQWNTATNTLVGSLSAFGSTGSTGSVAGGATFDLTFGASSPVLNAGTTYALLLSYQSGATTFGANFSANPADAFFGSGGTGSVATSFGISGSLPTFQSSLQNMGRTTPKTGQAYSMSVDGTLAATPEPTAAAAAFAALFVVGLVGRRVWQRRQPAAPVPLAA